LACPRARFNRTREGYKMISSEIYQTRGLPVTNPSFPSPGGPDERCGPEYDGSVHH